ncbi:AMP-dependent synthetase/ligase [Nocardioides sp. Kera G14]|uniref:AMP-dependent synthetase/ligase n=1 Tax=Nocardioides sp. Kera G14 TaxID=2884264 RepID=UPI001D108BCE|nr:AMP-dependent synthetase/ligase [Nocardioides sp. Kera G14]UDY24821.1 AMP-dependent synthetase/ligase [Nocardioides sp. Kera G14]
MSDTSHTSDTSFLDTMPANVAIQFLDRVAADPDGEAFLFPHPGGHDGDHEGQHEHGEHWHSVTWREVGDHVEKLAAGLVSLGINLEDRVGIAASTRYEWILADLAVMCAGGATTTVYPSSKDDDVAWILGDSECRVVFAEDDEQIGKIEKHAAELGSLIKIVTFDGTADGNRVISLDHLETLGEEYLATREHLIADIAKQIQPDQLATLVYTSGTTGRSKGVRLLHRSWVYEGAAIQAQDILSTNDLQFLWLPMSHVFGKVLLSTQLAIGFPTAIDGRVDRIIDNLALIRPTFMGAAPRIFEKAYARIVTMVESEGGVKKKLFDRAFAVGRKYDALIAAEKSIPLTLQVQHALLDILVLRKVRERFGGRIRFMISGSAALNPEIASWFHAAGLMILEGYGMTENAAGAAVNRPEDNRIGTVGPAIPGSEIRIGEHDEVQIKGPHVMAGYHNNEAATADTFTADGWLRTGDKGSLDADGYLTITGRLKEIFKTSGGKYIAPNQIEAKFKALCPYASQFVVFGAERNFAVALVTLDPDAIEGWAAEKGLAGASYADIVSSAAAREMVGGYVAQLNEQLNRWETIKKWEILDHDLSIESGELTPSLKVKRAVVERNNDATIAGFYS